MSDKPWPQPTTKQKFRCLGWVLLAIILGPPLLLLSIPSTLAVWIKERRDGFTKPTPEESTRLHQRLAQKKQGDVILIDGVPHTIDWLYTEKDNPGVYIEFHLTNGYSIHSSAESFSVMYYHPRWWFIKSGLRLNFKDVE